MTHTPRTTKVANPERLTPAERLDLLVERIEEEEREDWIEHAYRIKRIRERRHDLRPLFLRSR